MLVLKGERLVTEGEKDTRVDADPFRNWLTMQDRKGWSTILNDSQERYIERLLDKRGGPRRISPYCVDEILLKLKRPGLLHVLYPE